MRDVTRSYSTEADIEFVRASVHAIGRCALKVDSTVDKCSSVLLTLLQSKISYVVQETCLLYTSNHAFHSICDFTGIETMELFLPFSNLTLL